MSPPARLWASRAALACVLLAAWELFGRYVDDTWTSRPSEVAARLAEWAAGGLGYNVAVTVAEMAAGLAIGLPCGTLLGLWLGRSRHAAAVLRPFVVALNSLPVVALAPLLIMWFGLGLAPKIALVAFVSFLLLFFSTFAGAEAVDGDVVATLEIMGASGPERFRKVVLPGATAWIMAGLKNALPYALIAATIGEMMLSRAGLGFLIAEAGQEFDMTGTYAALFVLMVLGALTNGLASGIERRLLRWRGAGTS
jgi:NitT/TauT family transport system permease protein